MRHGLMKDPDWEYIGALLADAEVAEQVLFFTGFVKECNAWGTRIQIERQLVEINLKLSQGERSVLQAIGYEEGK